MTDQDKAMAVPKLRSALRRALHQLDLLLRDIEVELYTTNNEDEIASNPNLMARQRRASTARRVMERIRATEARRSRSGSGGKE